MNTAIITGANGFVGTWLSKELTGKGVKVFAVIKDEKENISLIESFQTLK